MFVVWALARPEWHGSCTISHRFDSWKGPWQDGRGRSSDSICMHLPCFQFRLVSGVQLQRSILAKLMWFSRFSMNHKAGYMLPFLGALGTFELYDSWMANNVGFHLACILLLHRKVLACFMICNDLAVSNRIIRCHFTPDFYPAEALYLTFNGWEKAVTFHAVILKIWALTDSDSVKYGEIAWICFHDFSYFIYLLLPYTFLRRGDLFIRFSSTFGLEFWLFSSWGEPRRGWLLLGKAVPPQGTTWYKQSLCCLFPLADEFANSCWTSVFFGKLNNVKRFGWKIVWVFNWISDMNICNDTGYDSEICTTRSLKRRRTCGWRSDLTSFHQHVTILTLVCVNGRSASDFEG